MSEDRNEVSLELPVAGKLKGIFSDRFLSRNICVLILMAISIAITYLAVVLHEHDQYSKQINISLKNLTTAINMQTCLSTLPLDQRPNEYRNPNSPCSYLSGVTK